MGEKTCLVIGGGRGMGAATAREMHNRGYKLSLMSPSDSCEQLAEDLKGVALRGKAENKENKHIERSFARNRDNTSVHMRTSCVQNSVDSSVVAYFSLWAKTITNSL